MKLSLGASKKSFGAFLQKIKAIPWILGTHAFLSLVLFMLLGILIGAFLFYKYVFLANIDYLNVHTTPVKFQETTYTSVLQEWQERESAFNNTSEETYGNPFQ